MMSIYNMMGRCTRPALRDYAPAEHVELFFQVRASPSAQQTQWGWHQGCHCHPLGLSLGPGCHCHTKGLLLGPSPLSPISSPAEDGQERRWRCDL